MKKYLLLFFSFAAVSLLYAQNFSGLNNGNYAGISGVMLQPASIVDSRHKFDINLFSTDVRYSNNYFLLDRNVLLKFNTKNFGDYQTFRSKYLSEANLPRGEKVFFNISNRTQLPLSFMATLSNKSAVALNIQSRSLIQGRNISQDVAQLAFNDFYHPPLTNRSLDASGISLRSLNWAEVGLTYGRVLFNSGNHFLKGAVTAKYLAGVSSLDLFTNDLRLQVNSDSTFNFTGNNIRYNHNEGADFTKLVDKRFRPDANALGLDAGLVYEYRGQLDKFKYIRNDDERSYEALRRDLNKYIFRLGVSVLDAGMFTFDKPANVSSFNAAINGWDIRRADYSSLEEFDTALANRVSRVPNDPRLYNVYLPGALSAQLDIRFVKGLFLNATAYRPLKMGNKNGYRFNNYGYYSITPRYERRHFGIYLPYTFSDKEDVTNYRDNWLGLSMRVGPLFFGSNNLGSMAFNQNLKAADVFVGLKVGFTYGKPSKVERLLTNRETDSETAYEKLVREKEELEQELAAAQQRRSQTASDTAAKPDTLASNRMVVDYSKGQVYAGSQTFPVIIVNNNYYYGPAGPPKTDTVYSLNNRPPNVAALNQPSTDSATRIKIANVKRTDSVNRVLVDSLSQKRDQVDSLINRLNNLRQKMDSATNTDNASGFVPKQNNSDQIGEDSTTRSTVVNDTLATGTDSTVEARVANDTTVKQTDTQTNERRLKSDASSKKKVNAKSPASPANNNATPARTTNRAAEQPAQDNTQLYQLYLEQTERLQADIARLERQLSANRMEAIAYRQPVYPQPVYYNPRPAYNSPPVYYPLPPAKPVPAATAAAGQMAKKDTVFIRDTVYVTRVDTVTRKPVAPADAGFKIYARDTVVEKTTDYSRLPPENVLFATGKATIREVYVAKLSYFATVLRQHPDLKIAISGHTDNTGPAAANELLSLKRANAVKTFFLQKGIAENRMQVSAVADNDPLIDGKTPAAKAQNRRVEVRILQ